MSRHYTRPCLLPRHDGQIAARVPQDEREYVLASKLNANTGGVAWWRLGPNYPRHEVTGLYLVCGAETLAWVPVTLLRREGVVVAQWATSDAKEDVQGILSPDEHPARGWRYVSAPEPDTYSLRCLRCRTALMRLYGDEEGELWCANCARQELPEEVFRAMRRVR